MSASCLDTRGEEKAVVVRAANAAPSVENFISM
jgi:hypothetical protein